MRDLGAKLDAVEAFDPGTGKLDAFLFGRGTRHSGAAGVGVTYGHRISERLAAFADAEAAWRYGTASGMEYSGKAGIRLTF